MRRQLRSKSRKKVVTPGGRTVVHFVEKRPGRPRCGRCGAKLNAPANARMLAKSSRRPERRFPELCTSCSREAIKEKLMGV